MKNILPLLLTIIALLPSFSNASAQETLVASGDKYYQDLKFYEKAISYYQSALKKDPKDVEVKLKLADCLRLTNTLQGAAVLYSEASQENAKLASKHLLRYGMVLMGLGKYEDAKKVFEKYATNDQTVGKRFIQNCDFALANMKNTPEYGVRTQASNSPQAEFGLALFKDLVIFGSFRNEAGTETNRLYQSAPENDGSLKTAKTLNERVPRYNLGPLAFTKDGAQVAYCDNLLRSGVRPLSETDMRLTMYVADAKTASNWEEEQRFKYNREGASTGYPCFSLDGNQLFFASNMPGGYGGFDLYVCTRNGKRWSTPENLGADINTPGDEISPFIGADGTFYFSSDWLPGFGGLDVFAASFKKNKYTSPKNLGIPINSSYDDYSFVMRPDTAIAYFISNRSSGKGLDDVYIATKVVAPVKPEKEKAVLPPPSTSITYIGYVTDLRTKEPISDVVVRASRPETGQTWETTTNLRGEYSFELEPGFTYATIFSANGYQNTRMDLVTTKDEPILAPARLDRAGTAAKPKQPVASKDDKKAANKNEGKLPDKAPADPNAGKNPVVVKDQPKSDQPKPDKKSDTKADKKEEAPVAAKAPEKPAGDKKDPKKPLPLPEAPKDNKKAPVESPDVVEYRVQLGAFKSPPENAFADLSEWGTLESAVETNGLTYYYLRGYYSLDAAKKARTKAVLEGVENAFIVAFKNGKKTKLTEAAE